MTQRRMPRRDRANGRFINRQRGARTVPKEEKRTVAPPLPPPMDVNCAEQGPAWPKLLKRPERKFCEECGTEMQETRTIVRGKVIFLTSCPRCCEDPVGGIRGD